MDSLTNSSVFDVPFDNNPDPTLVRDAVLRLLMWLASVAIACAVDFQFTQPINIPECMRGCIDRMCMTTHGGLQIDCVESHMNMLNRYRDSRATAGVASLLFLWNEIFNNQFTWEVEIVGCVLLTVVGITFALLGRLKGMNTTCTFGRCKDWPVASICLYTIASALALSLFGYNLYLAIEKDIWIWYLIMPVLIPIVYVILWFTVFKKDTGVFHIHHWWIGLYIASLCVFSEPFSRIGFYIFCGVFLEGATLYGYDTLFND